MSLVHLLAVLTACDTSAPSPTTAPAPVDVGTTDTAPPEGTSSARPYAGDCWDPAPPVGPDWLEATAYADTHCLWFTTYDADCPASVATLSGDETSFVQRWYDANGQLISTLSGVDYIEATQPPCDNPYGEPVVSPGHGRGVLVSCAPLHQHISAGCLGSNAPFPSPSPSQVCSEPLPPGGAPTFFEAASPGTCVATGVCRAPSGDHRLIVVEPHQARGALWMTVYDPATGARVAAYETNSVPYTCAGTWYGEPHPDCYSVALTPSAGCATPEL